MKQSVLCIAGPSGGTGKSSIAKELSIAFSHQVKTCLVDLDLSCGGQNSLFKILPKKNIMDWIGDYHRDRNLHPLQELRYPWDYIQKFLALSFFNSLYLLPAPGDGHVHELEVEDLEMILLHLLEYFEVVILDTGSNLDSATQAAMVCSDRTLLVSTADQTCIDNIKKLRRYIRQKDWDMDKFSLIINRQPAKKALYSPEEIEDILYMPVIGTIPDEKNHWMLNNAGISVVSDPENSPYKQSLLKLQTAVSR